MKPAFWTPLLPMLCLMAACQVRAGGPGPEEGRPRTPEDTQAKAEEEPNERAQEGAGKRELNLRDEEKRAASERIQRGREAVMELSRNSIEVAREIRALRSELDRCGVARSLSSEHNTSSSSTSDAVPSSRETVWARRYADLLRDNFPLPVDTGDNISAIDASFLDLAVAAANGRAREEGAPGVCVRFYEGASQIGEDVRALVKQGPGEARFQAVMPVAGTHYAAADIHVLVPEVGKPRISVAVVDSVASPPTTLLEELKQLGLDTVVHSYRTDLQQSTAGCRIFGMDAAMTLARHGSVVARAVDDTAPTGPSGVRVVTKENEYSELPADLIVLAHASRTVTTFLNQAPAEQRDALRTELAAIRQDNRGLFDGKVSRRTNERPALREGNFAIDRSRAALMANLVDRIDSGKLRQDWLNRSPADGSDQARRSAAAMRQTPADGPRRRQLIKTLTLPHGPQQAPN